MADLGMNFLSQPEITSSGCDANFTLADAKFLLNQDLSGGNPNSLLSPKNMYTFESNYENGDWTGILTNQNLSQGQANCIYSYSF